VKSGPAGYAALSMSMSDGAGLHESEGRHVVQPWRRAIPDEEREAGGDLPCEKQAAPCACRGARGAVRTQKRWRSVAAGSSVEEQGRVHGARRLPALRPAGSAARPKVTSQLAVG